MPLDPQFTPIIDRFASMPALEDIPIELVRQAPKLINQNPTPVDSVINRTIPGPAGEINVRLYRSGQNGPLLVFFHGGGFIVGDLDSHDEVARVLTAQLKCTTVAVDYRLAPEHPFPAAPDDCFAALTWAVAHASELGADASRTFVVGDSAGGNLAAVTARRARDAGRPTLKGQVLIYPVTDFTSEKGPGPDGKYYVINPKSSAYFNKCYLAGDDSNATNPDASPGLAKDLSKLPPALVITAEYDPLLKDGETYAAKLKAAGVDATLSRYNGAPHGFASFPTPMGIEALKQCADWMRAHA